jgi:hypothetical protein
MSNGHSHAYRFYCNEFWRDLRSYEQAPTHIVCQTPLRLPHTACARHPSGSHTQRVPDTLQAPTHSVCQTPFRLPHTASARHPTDPIHSVCQTACMLQKKKAPKRPNVKTVPVLTAKHRAKEVFEAKSAWCLGQGKRL